MLCKVLPEKCIACGLCQIYAPTIFDYDNEGIVCLINTIGANTKIIEQEFTESLLLAYRKCPVHAIEVMK